MRDPGTLRQLARLSLEAEFGEEADGLAEDLLLAIGRGQPPLAVPATETAARPPAAAGRVVFRRSAQRRASLGYGASPFAGMIGSSR